MKECFMKSFRKSLWLALALVFVLTGSMIASAQDVVTVTWWTEDGAYLEHVQNTFVKAFNDAHPNIKLELIPQQGLNDLIRTALSAGEAPDILQTPGASFVAELLPAGAFLPLTEAAEANGWEDKLLPWAYQSGIIEGELYSIPLTYESMVLFYNKTLFEEQGWTMPTNIDELNALAEQITAAGKHVFAYGNAEWQPSNEHLVGVYWNNYAGPENVYKALIGEKSWTDPEFVEATELLRSQIADQGWYSGSVDNYYAYTGPDMYGEFVSGDAAMMLTGTWAFRSMDEYFTEEMGAEWDWAPIPMFNNDVGEYIYLLATGSTISVNGNSPNADAAVEVLNFLLSDPQLVLANSAGSSFGEWLVPMHFQESDFPEGTDERLVRFFSDFAKVTGEGRYGYTTWTFWPAKPNVQLWQDVESVWAGDISVEDYLAGQQALWDESRAANETLPVPERS
jgi:raffinose/stachyose/melibiose transport system substrate-binding protein